MVNKKEKRKKRKHSGTEIEDERNEDKFLAYTVKKTPSSNKQQAAVPDIPNKKPSVKSSNIRTKIAEKKANYNLRETNNTGMFVPINAGTFTASSDTDIKEKRTFNIKKIEIKKKNKKSSNKQEIQKIDIRDSNVKLIVPKTFNLEIENFGISPNLGADFLEEEISNPCSEAFEPIVIEANLKKSSKSYLPINLKSRKEIVTGSEWCETKQMDVSKKLSKLSCNDHKNLQDASCTTVQPCGESSLNINKESSIKLNKRYKIPLKKNTAKCGQPSTCDAPSEIEKMQNDVPTTLQEFYKKVVKDFEALSDKPMKNNNKRSKQWNVVNNTFSEDLLISPTSNKENDSLHFFSLEHKVIVIMGPKTLFAFLGKLRLQVLYGFIRLYGADLDRVNTANPVEIFSPKGFSPVSISNLVMQNDLQDKEYLWDVLTSEGVDRSLKTKLHDSINECKEGWSVILLENFENSCTNFLNSYSSYKLFPKVENLKYPWNDFRRAEYVLQANIQISMSGDEIAIAPQWNEDVIGQLVNHWSHSKSLCTILAGGKNVGKSTTARYLINNLLKYSKKVILLDLDPGQAEMTPAGCLSLSIIEKPMLGPNFTHLKIPFHQLFLEDINVSNCITRYLECCKNLVKTLKSRKDLLQYPIIVNTMGFCTGIGLDINIFLMKLIEPNHVIQIMSKKSKNNFDFALKKETVSNKKTSSISLNTEDSAIIEKSCEYVLHYVSTTAEGKRLLCSWNMEPRQHRELVLLSYISQIVKNNESLLSCTIGSSGINSVVPFMLPFSSFYIALTKSSISPTHILAAMNGNIVALCGIDLENETLDDPIKSQRYPKVLIKPPPFTCYGYGIVRGIDMKKRCIYINTPLTLTQLECVNLLAGCSTVPFNLLNSNMLDLSPYAGDRSELPVSREPRRGYFRVEQSKKP